MAYKFLSTILGIDANFTGNVGVGTTTPTNKLDVIGTSYFSTDMYVGQNHGIFFNGNGGYAMGLFSSGSDLLFQGGSVERMRLTSAGNLGLGTTNPQSELDIYRASNPTILLRDSSAIARLLPYAGNVYFQTAQAFSGGSTADLYFTGMYGTPVNMLIKSTGNVLIGTTTDAGYKLQVNGSTTSGYANQSALLVTASGTASTQNAIAIQQLTSEGDTTIFADYEPYAEYGITAKNSSDSIDFTGGTAVNYLDSYNITNRSGNARTAYVKARIGLASGVTWFGGNVGIGTSSPGYRLTVDGGDIYFNSANASASYYLRLNHNNSYDGGILLTRDVSTYDWQMNNSAGTGDFIMYSYGIGNVALTLKRASGNLLIGTTTDAGYKLDVNGTGRFSGNLTLTNSGNIGMYLSRGLSTSSNSIIWQTASTFDWFLGSSPLGTSTSDLSLYSYGTSSIVLNIARSTGVFTLSSLSGSGTRMVVADSTGTLSTQSIPTGTVTGSGTTNYVSKWSSSSSLTNSLLYDNGTNVGIGTTSPAAKLEVRGSTAQLLISQDATHQMYFGVDNSYAEIQAIRSGIAFDKPLILQRQGGNVGIGATNPAAKLHLSQSSGNTESIIEAIGGTPIFTMLGTSSSVPLFGFNGTGLRIGSVTGANAAGFSELMRITSAGNVGIGTTSPTAKLTVVGEGTGLALIGDPGFVGSNYTAISLNNTLSTSSYNFLSSPTDATLYINRPSGVSIRFREANGANQMVIETGGNVLIGTSTDNGNKLQVNGSATIGSSGGADFITINGGPNGTASYYGSGVGNGSWDSRPNGNAPYINQWHTGLTFSANSYYGGIRFYNQAYPNVYSSTLVMSVTNDAVGIGTTSPSSKLHVDNPGYSFIAGYDAGNRRVYIGLDSSGEPSIQSALSNGVPRQLDINPLGGNVGIGTTNPNGFATTGRTILSLNGASNTLIEFKVGDAFQNYIYSTTSTFELYSSSIIDFQSLGASRLRIASSGNVLVGTTTDNGAKLQVSGRASIYTGASVTDAVAFTASDGSNALNFIPYVGTGSYNNLSYGGGSLLFNNISSRLTVGTHNGTAIQFGPTDTLISGAITLFSLAGSGTRMVVADASGVLSTQAIPGGGGVKAYGSWQNNNTQLSPANNFPTPVIYDTLNFNNNVIVDNDSSFQYTLIRMLVDGRFNIQFSFEFRNTSSSDEDVNIWFRKNGETTSDDIPNSNTLISIPAKHGSGTPGHTVAAWNFFVEATAGEFFQIVWATSNKAAITMEYIPPTAFCPGTPSAILTVNKID